jgi:hypothetical protein
MRWNRGKIRGISLYKRIEYCRADNECGDRAMKNIPIAPKLYAVLLLLSVVSAAL